MELHIAKRAYDFEGFAILGVFSTLALAQKACDADVNEYDGSFKGDGHYVETVTLDAIIPNNTKVVHREENGVWTL